MKTVNKNQNQIKSIVIGGGFGGIAISLDCLWLCPRSLGHSDALSFRPPENASIVYDGTTGRGHLGIFDHGLRYG